MRAPTDHLRPALRHLLVVSSGTTLGRSSRHLQSHRSFLLAAYLLHSNLAPMSQLERFRRRLGRPRSGNRSGRPAVRRTLFKILVPAMLLLLRMAVQHPRESHLVSFRP